MSRRTQRTSRGMAEPGGVIVWRLRLAASPERVFDAWVNPADHTRFWCERSEPIDGGFRLQFVDGTVETCRVEHLARPSAIVFRYFGDLVELELRADEGLTDLTLRTHPANRDEWLDIYTGWLNVLLPFKAWIDFGIDLRNHDPSRTWRHRYVDQ